MNIGTLFTGFGGVDIGAQAAGIDHAWGLECDSEIAAVATANGFPCVVADILEVDPRDFAPVDVLHASPPCPNFSVAKQGRSETVRDIAMAEAVAAFIEELRPRVFTLENVIGYRKALGFSVIGATLDRLGYFYDVAHINSADYGVPQIRRRLWLRAVRGGLVSPLPAPEPWVGWYQAIEDLLPTLPASQFAPWQMARLPEKLSQSLLVDSAGYVEANGRLAVMRDANAPANVIVANHARRPMRAFIVDDQGNATPGSERGLTIRDADAPMFTVSATQTKRSIRAWLSQGRVVTMTPRCLARFQSFPDWYALPKSSTLACRGIGNAVPPLVYQRLMEVAG